MNGMSIMLRFFSNKIFIDFITRIWTFFLLIYTDNDLYSPVKKESKFYDWIRSR